MNVCQMYVVCEVSDSEDHNNRTIRLKAPFGITNHAQIKNVVCTPYQFSLDPATGAD